MTLSEFEEAFQELIEDSEDELINSVRDHQDEVAKELIRLMQKRLILDNEGKVVITGADGRKNRLEIAKIRGQIEAKIKTKKILKTFREYAEAFIALAGIYTGFYKAFVPKFVSSPTKDMAKSARDRVIETLAGGLGSEMVQGVSEILDMAFGSATLEQIEDRADREIRTKTVRKKRKTEVKTRGHFERFVNNIVFANGTGNRAKVRDSLHGFGGAVSDQIRQDNGLMFIRYGDGRVDDSRKFCLKHKGGYYHIDEVLSWVGDKWEGKNTKMTKENALILRGGYNCMHPWIPVPVSAVPKKWIDRAVRLGYYDS